MCLSPLRIKDNSVYHSQYLTSPFREVPCGRCAECASVYMKEWQTRICFELDALYKRGGIACFLTFTYDDAHLPFYNDDSSGIHVRCFNHDDVLTFLNRLKIQVYRKFGRGCYKYFFVSEYGKDTRRPHYHCLFFLEPLVTDRHWFIEKCRELWSSSKYGHHGFMFPKYSKAKHCYVDSFNECYDPFVSSLLKSAKYVSKYVTKDMSYFGMPELVEYLKVKKNKERMKRFLPKHWQSNRLGYSIVELFDPNEPFTLREALVNGIYNPITSKMDALPRFVVNKLLYDNVRSTDTSISRFSETVDRNGKPVVLYDRQISAFGDVYMRYVFESHVSKLCDKIQRVFMHIFQYDRHTYSLLSPILNSYSININDSVTFRPLALYHELFRYSSDAQLGYLLDLFGGSSDVFSDVDACYFLWRMSRDTEYLRTLRLRHILDGVSTDLKLGSELFFNLDILDKYFCRVSRTLSKNRCDEMERQKLLYDSLRRKFKTRFSTKLC